MEQVVVKSEMQSNEEILLFYVDENGYNEDGVITATANIEQLTEDSIQQTVYIEENPDESDNDDDLIQPDANEEEVEWTKYDSQRLLTFYADNRETFISGSTKRKFLWSVACKTMLMGKTPYSCEVHLNELMRKYAQALIDERNGVTGSWQTWPLLSMAQQVFHDDSTLEGVIEQLNSQQEIIVPEMTTANEVENIVNVKRVNASRSTADQNVVNMLTLYLKHKNSLKNLQKDFWQRGLWETIALELGNEEDAEYWHKRFLNFKHNYIRLLEKRKAEGAGGINWPYMDLFDQIFANDEEFQRKYKSPTVQILSNQIVEIEHNISINTDTDIWNSAELTVLVKYYYDCFDEFQDPTIPKKFLWNEVGRLLDKNPEVCKAKYESLKSEHIAKYISESYDIVNRIPVEILFDNIICKETEIEMCKSYSPKKTGQTGQWTTEELDALVQFICNCVEMFKDPICYFVCWAVVAYKLKKSILDCRQQLEELVTLYKTILADKKENPDMQIDWRYIDLFDRIYDYGMDENLLAGYDNLKPKESNFENNATSAKSSTNAGKLNQNNEFDDNGPDDEDFDESGFTKSSRKAFKILEFYQKNKLKFTTTKKQSSLWSVLGKELSLTATQCAHRFRNLKQVYVQYVQREINKPDKPITWPYYQLCKKVFGYRELRNKLKSRNFDPNDKEDWSSTDINQLIAYFAKHYNEITENSHELNLWAELSSEIGRSPNACRDKFLELRKSYRKLKTMKTRNPSVKVNWKYFTTFDELYQYASVGGLEGYEAMEVDEDVSKGLQEDDDIQCIFVIPEGQDVNDLNNLSAMNEEKTEVTSEPAKVPVKWNKQSKKRLLFLYLNYIKAHRFTEISRNEMWKEIASKFQNKSTLSCRKMFAKLKKMRLAANDDEVKKQTPYYALLEKIVALNPKFKKNTPKNDDALIEETTCKDVPMSTENVQKALEFYLENVEEFVSPRFEKKYAWNNLSKAIGEPLNKVFNKVNYLKNNIEENSPFIDILRQIEAKENAIKVHTGNDESKVSDETETAWSDSESEQLLIWYLANLDKFKNPKFVRKYLWIESANILSKTPLACSKKMSEIRTEYRNMVREKPDELNGWKFYELCQKIYGTGKQKASETGQE